MSLKKVLREDFTQQRFVHQSSGVDDIFHYGPVVRSMTILELDDDLIELELNQQNCCLV